MVQEVQQQGNWYQDPNRIQGIGISERKVSDHTQVRNEWRNGCTAKAQHNQIYNAIENFNESWTVTEDETVKYRTKDGKLFIPLPGTYMIDFQIASPYGTTNNVKFRIYNGNRVIYTLTTVVNDTSWHRVLLNLGKKNELRTSYYVSGIGGNVYYIPVNFKIAKL